MVINGYEDDDDEDEEKVTFFRGDCRVGSTIFQLLFE